MTRAAPPTSGPGVAASATRGRVSRARRRARHRAVGLPRGGAMRPVVLAPSARRRRLAWRRLAVHALVALVILGLLALVLLPAILHAGARP